MRTARALRGADRCANTHTHTHTHVCANDVHASWDLRALRGAPRCDLEAHQLNPEHSTPLQPRRRLLLVTLMPTLGHSDGAVNTRSRGQ
eukprot:9245031-Pyramimonas_sp.AAC.2